LLYATERLDEDQDLGTQDRSEEAVAEKVQEVFAQTKEMLLNMAAEHGVDLSEVDDAAFHEQEEERHQRIRSHPLARHARKYTRRVEAWFKKHSQLFETKGRQLRKSALLQLPDTNPAADAAAIVDAVEVIRWYQYQLHAKLVRALSSRDDQEEWGEDGENDANGSAKVALIGLERSMASWGKLRQHMDDQADTILDILRSLDKLRRLTLELFPEAPAFLRPGFDTPVAPSTEGAGRI
jgi:hypothetical protein